MLVVDSTSTLRDQLVLRGVVWMMMEWVVGQWEEPVLTLLNE